VFEFLISLTGFYTLIEDSKFEFSLYPIRRPFERQPHRVAFTPDLA
jgi:hypothetical protein